MKHSRSALVILACVLLAAPGAAMANESHQYVNLTAAAGGNTSFGVAWLDITKERNGYRLHGYVRSDAGCVELRAVNAHFGTEWGGDPVLRTCETGVKASVTAWTHHTDVVLVAVVGHGPDHESRIITLTGR